MSALPTPSGAEAGTMSTLPTPSAGDVPIPTALPRKPRVIFSVLVCSIPSSPALTKVKRHEAGWNRAQASPSGSRSRSAP
eukprot:scaffold27535_cov116-Isochrysis_galbana.AAC.1